MENAVSHGLEPKKESGIIRVCMYEENFIEENDEIKKQKKTSKILHIIVEDNGVGIDYEKMNEKPKEEAQQPEKIDHTHTGFENTRKMLQILYGENYKFNIWSEKGKGTKIEIILPAERGKYHVESSGGG